MAHRVHRGVWGGIKIKLGYEGCSDGFGQTTESIVMKTGLDET
jgi:hypothetical protein